MPRSGFGGRVGQDGSRFLFKDTSSTVFYALSLRDALPISTAASRRSSAASAATRKPWLRRVTRRRRLRVARSEEHTSELQSRFDFVCRLLLEKKNSRRDARTRTPETSSRDWTSTTSTLTRM